jgi:AcrR family transcriptional regulator
MKGEDRRASIVAAAIRLFSEKGFRGATTRELAASLGVTEPVLYQHFRTKSDLYAAILEHGAEDDNRGAELAAVSVTGDDRRYFTRLAELILDKYDQDSAYMRLMFFSALERHELASMFYGMQVVQFYETVAAYIRRRMEEGAFRTVNPRIAGRTFIGTMSERGFARMLFGADDIDDDQFIAEAVETFLRGLATNA